ncbi:insulin enhancer protein isl-1-like [Tropilaelaps mercedesae]|uniref:Insulin enhancer protein isl-1-like n=1 Tax=Tropilaelaps mercedesae TaxID=418985 RepID=A0A1V9WZM1_9ACAR|nr:insulin enhancer protein isl-1-like [Tropilaelaps mercedesae]
MSRLRLRTAAHGRSKGGWAHMSAMVGAQVALRKAEFVVICERTRCGKRALLNVAWEDAGAQSAVSARRIGGPRGDRRQQANSGNSPKGKVRSEQFCHTTCLPQRTQKPNPNSRKSPLDTAATLRPLRLPSTRQERPTKQNLGGELRRNSDQLRLFGATGLCSACHKSIPAFEMVMRARSNVYHLECFACQQCNHRFCVGDRFFLYENRILCEYDYEERMVFSQMGAYGCLQGGPPMQPPGHVQSGGHPGHPGHSGSPYGPMINGALHSGGAHVGPHHSHQGAPMMPLNPANQQGLDRSSLATPMQQSTNHSANNNTSNNNNNPHKRQQQQQQQQSQMNGNISQQQQQQQQQQQPQQSPVQAGKHVTSERSRFTMSFYLGTPGAPNQPEADILFDVGVSPATPNSLNNSQTPTQNNGPNGGPK